MEVNDILCTSYSQLYPTYASHNKVQLRKMIYSLALSGIIMVNIPKDYSTEGDLNKHATNTVEAYHL